MTATTKVITNYKLNQVKEDPIIPMSPMSLFLKSPTTPTTRHDCFCSLVFPIVFESS